MGWLIVRLAAHADFDCLILSFSFFFLSSFFFSFLFSMFPSYLSSRSVEVYPRSRLCFFCSRDFLPHSHFSLLYLVSPRLAFSSRSQLSSPLSLSLNITYRRFIVCFLIAFAIVFSALYLFYLLYRCTSDPHSCNKTASRSSVDLKYHVTVHRVFKHCSLSDLPIMSLTDLIE